jgi:hypothetical protein
MRAGLCWAVGLATGSLLAGCYREQKPEPPPFVGQPIEQVPRATVLDYARRIPYMEISGDSQRLMLGSCPADCRYGPRAHIDPASRSYELNDAALASGRILARVINVDTIPYPKLNLGPQDTVYWWVDGTGGRLRSVLVSSRPDVPPVVTGFRSEPHPEQKSGWRWRQAQARFGWRDTDEELWVACDWAECCRAGDFQ